MTATVLNTKICEIESKILNHDKYITTHEFINLTTEIFAARLKQIRLVTTTDFDNKLTSYKRQITPNRPKHLEVRKKLNSVITNHYIYFLGRNFFASNDRSQNTFVYQQKLSTLELRKSIDYVIS